MKSPSAKEKTKATELECLECGRIFKKVLKTRTYEVKCPQCGSYDVEVR